MDLTFLKERIASETQERIANALKAAGERTEIATVAYYNALKKERYDQLTPKERKLIHEFVACLNEEYEKLTESYENLKLQCERKN